MRDKAKNRAAKKRYRERHREELAEKARLIRERKRAEDEAIIKMLEDKPPVVAINSFVLGNAKATEVLINGKKVLKYEVKAL